MAAAQVVLTGAAVIFCFTVKCYELSRKTRKDVFSKQK